MKPKIYLVGGAVRDKLLGNDPKDLDYVVVGADLQWMLGQGFKQVGASFPVFLHPETGDEYAMARREKKVAPGYQGFEFEFGSDVTLEEDLSRRDLTMNSIAFDLENSVYIDPFGGIADMNSHLIRHTSDAFAEDPLRVLRTARFAARYDFDVAVETEALCKQLVESGELDALSADRIWGEMAKLFSEAMPTIGLKFLSGIGALEIKRLKGLVFEPVRSLFVAEAELSTLAKMFFSLNIHLLTKDQVEEFRIPTHLARELKFVAKVYDLFLSSISGRLNAKMVVAAFDQFREEFKNSDLQKTRFLVQDWTDGAEVLDRLETAANALLELDFTELVKGLKPAEIKDFVSTMKAKTIVESWESINDGK